MGHLKISDKTLDILVDEMEGGLWAAAMADNKLHSLEVDPANEEVRWGSLYWAKVTRIDKTLNAAYLDLDGDNTGILNAGDVVKDDCIVKSDKSIGQLLSPGDFCFVQAKEGKLALKEGEAYEDKSPRLSMNIALQGRYIIYMPFQDEQRISRRIRDKKIRKQMTTMLESMGDCKSAILRASAMSAQTEILVREYKILDAMWESLKEHGGGDTPQLIMLGPDSLQRTLSNAAARIIDTIEVVTMEQFEEAEEWCDLFAPDLMTKIRPVELENPYDDLALFSYRDIFSEVDGLFQPYAILQGGGTIIIQETAALTAIDVNRAANTGSALHINRIAAKEIARQIRLRNLGGIIMIDFLRMKKQAEKKDLLKLFEEECLQDPCTVQVHGFTNLGLIEITRQRRTPSLGERFESTQIQ